MAFGKLRWICLAAVLSVSSTAGAGAIFSPNGLTKPSRRAEMNFSTPGLVKEVLVKPGDTVNVAQPLIQLDDSVERKQLEAIEIEAKSDLQTKAAEADLAQKRVELARKKQIQSNGGMNDAEVEDAQLAVVIGELKVKLAMEETLKKRAELEIQRTKLDRMRLISQMSGVVEKIDADPGEMTDPSKPAIVVVDNSKLDVEASLPVAEVAKLAVDDLVQVSFEDGSKPQVAKVIYLAPTADAAAATRLVRAQMANPQNKPSGMSVSVAVADQAKTGNGR